MLRNDFIKSSLLLAVAGAALLPHRSFSQVHLDEEERNTGKNACRI